MPWSWFKDLEKIITLNIRMHIVYLMDIIVGTPSLVWEISRAMPACRVWTFWNEKNRRFFEDKTTTVHILKYRCSVLSKIKSSKKCSRFIGALIKTNLKCGLLVKKCAMKVKNKSIDVIQEQSNKFIHDVSFIANTFLIMFVV